MPSKKNITKQTVILPKTPERIHEALKLFTAHIHLRIIAYFNLCEEAKTKWENPDFTASEIDKQELNDKKVAYVQGLEIATKENKEPARIIKSQEFEDEIIQAFI